MWPPGNSRTSTRVGVAHHRHLVHGEHRTHERARQIVPSVHDENPQLGIGGNGLAQIWHRALAHIIVALPEAIHVIRERVVASIHLPSHRAGNEVHHGGCEGRNDAGENWVVGALLRRKRKWIERRHVGVVDGAEFAFLAMHFAQVSFGFDASRRNTSRIAGRDRSSRSRAGSCAFQRRDRSGP